MNAWVCKGAFAHCLSKVQRIEGLRVRESQVEPPIGVEAMTYALRGRRVTGALSTNQTARATTTPSASNQEPHVDMTYTDPSHTQ